MDETYPINILSKSNEPFFNIKVLIQNTTSGSGDGSGGSGSSGNKALVIALPIVAGVIVIVAIVIIIIVVKKRKTRLSSQEISKELVSVGLKDDEN